jgi:hypothetical protein
MVSASMPGALWAILQRSVWLRSCRVICDIILKTGAQLALSTCMTQAITLNFSWKKIPLQRAD